MPRVGIVHTLPDTQNAEERDGGTQPHDPGRHGDQHPGETRLNLDQLTHGDDRHQRSGHVGDGDDETAGPISGAFVAILMPALYKLPLPN